MHAHTLLVLLELPDDSTTQSKPFSVAATPAALSCIILLASRRRPSETSLFGTSAHSRWPFVEEALACLHAMWSGEREMLACQKTAQECLPYPRETSKAMVSCVLTCTC